MKLTASARLRSSIASTSVDWLLSRTDAALNRAGFEVSVHKAVFAAEDAFEARMLGAQQRATEQRLQAMATTLAGKIAVP